MLDIGSMVRRPASMQEGVSRSSRHV